MGIPEQKSTTSATQTEPPREVTSETWIQMLDNLNTTLTSLKDEITDLKQFKGKLEDFSSQWKSDVDASITSSQSRQEQAEFQIKLLTNTMIRQEEKIASLDKKVTAAYKREIKPNMIIYGLIQSSQEETRRGTY